MQSKIVIFFSVTLWHKSAHLTSQIQILSALQTRQCDVSVFAFGLHWSGSKKYLYCHFSDHLYILHHPEKKRQKQFSGSFKQAGLRTKWKNSISSLLTENFSPYFLLHHYFFHWWIINDNVFRTRTYLILFCQISDTWVIRDKRTNMVILELWLQLGLGTLC